jgi:hypothetical protein
MLFVVICSALLRRRRAAECRTQLTLTSLARWNGILGPSDCVQVTVVGDSSYLVVSADVNMEVTSKFCNPDCYATSEVETNGTTSDVGSILRADGSPFTVQLTYTALEDTDMWLTFGSLPVGRCDRLYVDSHSNFSYHTSTSTLSTGSTCILSASGGLQRCEIDMRNCTICPSVTLYAGSDTFIGWLPNSGSLYGESNYLPLFVVINGTVPGIDCTMDLVVRLWVRGADRFRPVGMLFDSLGVSDVPIATTVSVESFEAGNLIVFMMSSFLGLFGLFLVFYVLMKEISRRRESKARESAVALSSISGPTGFAQTAQFVENLIED